MLKKILSTSLIYTFGPQLPKIVGFFMLPFLTPYLTNLDFGIWGTIMSYVLFFTTARDFGMLGPMVNSYYQHPTRWKWVWRQVFTFLLLFGILFTIIQALVLYYTFPEEGISNRNIVILLISIQTLVLDVPNQIGFRILQLKEKPLLLTYISVLSGFIALSVQLYVVIFLNQGYLGWFYATFYSSLFSAFCYLFIIYKNKVLPNFIYRFRLLKSKIKLSAYMLPHNFSSYLLGSSDRMVMNLNHLKTNEIGIYNVAYMWGNYVDIVGNAVGMAVGPTYLRLYSQKNENSENNIYSLTQLLQIFFVSGPFILSLWSKELFEIFIKNEELKKASSLSIIIIMGYSYRPLYWNVVNRLQFYYLTNQLWKISLVGGLINLVLNFILIPFYGYQAAAITTFFSLQYLGISGYYLKEYKKLDKKSYSHIFWFLLISISTALLFIIKDFNIYYKIFISLTVVLISFYFIIKKKLFKIS